MAKSHKKKRLEQRFGKKVSKPSLTPVTEEKTDINQGAQSKSRREKQSFLDKYYKQLLIIPFLLLVAALVVIGVRGATTGDYINRGISLKGGTSLELTNNMLDLKTLDVVALENHLRATFPKSDFNVRLQRQLSDIVAVEIETDMTAKADVESLKTELVNYIDELDMTEVSQNVKTSGSVLGESFFRQVLLAMVVAFVLMGIVIFIQFKVPVPSFAVMLAAFSDIVVTLAIIDIMGIKLSTAGIAAFLMLIGYSVDTDVLLSTRVLKNTEGTVTQRIHSAMKTGLTMNITTLAAVGVGLIVASSQTLIQIMTILFIGLLVDMVNTWIQNAGILRWYVERQEAKASKTNIGGRSE